MRSELTLESLYGYWVNCNDIWVLVPFEHDSSTPLMSDEMKNFTNKYQSFFRLATAYGLLYVVIEGYQELKLKDDQIDQLLQKTNYLEKLRLLRNYMFHFQEDPFSSKLMGFIELEESVEWIRKLRRSFESFFIKSLPIMEYIELAKKSIKKNKD